VTERIADAMPEVTELIADAMPELIADAMPELIADASADNYVWLSCFVFCRSSQSVGETAVCPASASPL
jgi:hypothetical protein